MSLRDERVPRRLENHRTNGGGPPPARPWLPAGSRYPTLEPPPSAPAHPPRPLSTPPPRRRGGECTPRLVVGSSRSPGERRARSLAPTSEARHWKRKAGRSRLFFWRRVLGLGARERSAETTRARRPSARERRRDVRVGALARLVRQARVLHGPDGVVGGEGAREGHAESTAERAIERLGCADDRRGSSPRSDNAKTIESFLQDARNAVGIGSPGAGSQGYSPGWAPAPARSRRPRRDREAPSGLGPSPRPSGAHRESRGVVHDAAVERASARGHARAKHQGARLPGDARGVLRRNSRRGCFRPSRATYGASGRTRRRMRNRPRARARARGARAVRPKRGPRFAFRGEEPGRQPRGRHESAADVRAVRVVRRDERRSQRRDVRRRVFARARRVLDSVPRGGARAGPDTRRRRSRRSRSRHRREG